MSVSSIGAEVAAWAADEAAQQCFGEDFTVDVTWVAQPIQTPAGVVMAVQWVLYMTTRNPLLGEPPLNHTAPLGPIRPGEADVRSQVSEGMRALRDLATRKLATVNGKP